MQLQIDPLVDADGGDLLDVAGTRAEGQTIQGMHRALLFARGWIGSGFLLVRDELWDGADQGQQSQAQTKQQERGLAKAGFHADSGRIRSLYYEPRRGEKLLPELILAAPGCRCQSRTSGQRKRRGGHGEC